MERKTIEQVTASIAVSLVFLMTIGLIISIADTFFRWNLFSPSIQTILYFIMICFTILIVSTVLVNIMINISIIASNMDKPKHD